MTAIYDNTSFHHKPGYVPGSVGSGCIPGARKLEMWKPEWVGKWAPDVTGDIMVHVEAGIEGHFDLVTDSKVDVLKSKGKLDSFCENTARTYPGVRQWWYCPPMRRWEWDAAEKGDYAAQKAIGAWRSATYDLAGMGVPGPRVHGVIVDCYDYWYMRDVWEKRVTDSIKIWETLKRPVLPIIYLGWLWQGAKAGETIERAGENYDTDTAVSRIETLLRLCGRVAIHGGYNQTVNARGEAIYQDYRLWPLRKVVEQYARGL